MAPVAAPALEILSRIVKNWTKIISDTGGPRFGDGILGRLQHVEASVVPLVQSPGQLKAHIVTEIVVTEGAYIGCFPGDWLTGSWQTCARALIRCTTPVPRFWWTCKPACALCQDVYARYLQLLHSGHPTAGCGKRRPRKDRRVAILQCNPPRSRSFVSSSSSF
jgi:hypothetical protein